MRTIAVLGTIALLASAACAALDEAEVDAVRADLQGRVAGLISAYQLGDALDNSGQGRSSATTSGGLGWGASGYLRRYLMCWQVSHDPYWLDKIIDHFDRMVANLSDHDGDGLLSWQDIGYSVGLVEVERVSQEGEGLTVAPPRGSTRIYVGRGGEDITGRDYVLEFIAADRFRFIDRTEGVILGAVDYADPTDFELMPGSKLTVTGAGVNGAVFSIQTTAPEPCEYQVHDGMVTFPIALFIEEVRATDGLDPIYGEKADEYLKLLDEHFVARWEKWWKPVSEDAGVYLFTDNPTQRFPLYSLPHNQYLAPARTCLVLGQLEGYENAELCADRARKMATYFHDNLRLTDEGAYEWNYWDPLPGEDRVKPNVEDTGHGTIDVGFAAEAARRGVVFSAEDMERFARTWVDVMWDGDEQHPRFGKRVNTNEGDQSAWWEYLQVAEWDKRAWDLAFAVFEGGGSSASLAPSLLSVYGRIAGIPEDVREQCRAGTEQVATLLVDEGLINGGFEVPSSTGEGVAGWKFFLWSETDPDSWIAWTDDAYSGEHAIVLTGVGATVNMGVETQQTLPVEPPGRVTLSIWYRADEAARPYLSIIGADINGKRAQYDSSPAFAATDEWTQATWEVELHEDVRSIRVLVRNGAAGTVCYDDVALQVQ